MPSSRPAGRVISLVILLVSVTFIGNFISREQSLLLFIIYALGFLSYLYIAGKVASTKLLLISGILARLTLFFSLPSLSDDIYRFIWDGALLKNGINPYLQLPAYYMENPIQGLDQTLYDQLNSPEYCTIYPPLNQFIFWLSAIVGNGNWLVYANTIRSFMLAADIGSYCFMIRLLKHYGMPSRLAFLYFLNPLVILEFVGNVHFEGIVICFLLAGLYWFERSKRWLSATFAGLAIATKLLPFIYLPCLFFEGLKNKKWTVAILATIMAIVTFLPFLNDQLISGMRNSIALYFKKFEFNASVYYLMREAGFQLYGHNKIAQIGPVLSIFTCLFILSISVAGVRLKWSKPRMFLYILTIYLVLATTVHPWYIIPLISFGVLAGYYYPIVWSLTIFLTYSGYAATGYELPVLFIMIEYIFVLIVFALEHTKVNILTPKPN